MAGIQNTKLKGLLAPRVIKQRGFPQRAWEDTVSSWLRHHLLSPAGERPRVNSTDSRGSAFSVYILRDSIAQESNHMCTSLQIQNSRWKSGLEGREETKDSCPQEGLGLCGALITRALKPEFWFETRRLTSTCVTLTRFLSQSHLLAYKTEITGVATK